MQIENLIMKSFLLLLCMATLVILSCKNNDKTVSQEQVTGDSLVKESINDISDSSLSGCYSMIVQRDTASLQLEVKGSHVSGSLSYNLFQKDRNDGTFDGEIKGDMILGWYLFRSEGLMSVRQVAWQVKPGKVIPANGEVELRNDSSFYKNPQALSFDSSRAFVKVPCVI